MDAHNLNADIKELSSKLDTEKKARNRWELARLLATILTPLAVVIVGTYLSAEASRRSEQDAQRQATLARIALIPSFIDALTSSDARKQMLAIRAIDRVLPDDGPAILQGVVEDGGPSVTNSTHKTTAISDAAQANETSPTPAYAPEIVAFATGTQASAVDRELGFLAYESQDSTGGYGTYLQLRDYPAQVVRERILQLVPGPTTDRIVAAALKSMMVFQQPSEASERNSVRVFAEAIKARFPNEQDLADQILTKLVGGA
ncbi:MAG: hypothetical protein ABI377_10625 [Devosia sp.]